LQDIKRALFECQSPEESECGSPKKKKRDPRRILSTSAPPSISGNNLLGKHPSLELKTCSGFRVSTIKSSIFRQLGALLKWGSEEWRGQKGKTNTYI
jgi:hypothetical protein